MGDIETIEQPMAGRLPIAGPLLIRERGPSSFSSSSREEGATLWEEGSPEIFLIDFFYSDL